MFVLNKTISRFNNDIVKCTYLLTSFDLTWYVCLIVVLQANGQKVEK